MIRASRIEVFPPSPNRTNTPSTFTEWQMTFVGPNHLPNENGTLTHTEVSRAGKDQGGLLYQPKIKLKSSTPKPKKKGGIFCNYLQSTSVFCYKRPPSFFSPNIFRPLVKRGGAFVTVFRVPQYFVTEDPAPPFSTKHQKVFGIFSTLFIPQ